MEQQVHTFESVWATLELEEACIKHGIAIIKQAGETVVIHDKHIKAY